MADLLVAVDLLSFGTLHNSFATCNWNDWNFSVNDAQKNYWRFYERIAYIRGKTFLGFRRYCTGALNLFQFSLFRLPPAGIELNIVHRWMNLYLYYTINTITFSRHCENQNRSILRFSIFFSVQETRLFVNDILKSTRGLWLYLDRKNCHSRDASPKIEQKSVYNVKIIYVAFSRISIQITWLLCLL